MKVKEGVTFYGGGIEPLLPTIIWKEWEMGDMDGDWGIWIGWQILMGAHIGDMHEEWRRRHIFSNGEWIGLEMGVYYALYQL